ncbi:polyadenylate-binding protein, cytoplasmic and nuclear-like [Stegodyphus dumicola]|uniref:polyadenylate-binding protein, cytoplasmic and nuclear-like n=1 Tax=Stegodyphus dumicola TaxID=202533 RepID=UPI0015B22392|nr:polyadenylate-binding protein, cytoplasmic and nuclear-like [Stegodyphus dumicola]
MSKMKNWLPEYPKELTKEEEQLKSKYEILRKLKARLLKRQTSFKENPTTRLNDSTGYSQHDLKKAAAEILMASGTLSKKDTFGKKTKDFKKPCKRNSQSLQAELKRCAGRKYVPEAEFEPRSITVRAAGISEQFLHHHFSCFGDIWKIRLDDDRESAVVTFKKPESARCASQKMNACFVEGKQLFVKCAKQKNISWTDISMKDRKNSMNSCSDRMKQTCHVSFQGDLTVQDFQDFFQNVGIVTRLYINRRKKFGFVTFENEVQANRAIEEMNGTSYKGVRLIISPQKILFSDTTICSHEEEKERGLLSYEDVHCVD